MAQQLFTLEKGGAGKRRWSKLARSLCLCVFDVNWFLSVGHRLKRLMDDWQAEGVIQAVGEFKTSIPRRLKPR
jgi:hypothetical protein